MLTATQAAIRTHEEFDDMVQETEISDYGVNEVDIGEVEINGKTMTVYIGIRQG